MIDSRVPLAAVSTALALSCGIAVFGSASAAAAGPLVQEGPKLAATPAGGEFGNSIAVSADGDTALIGSPAADGGAGAAWMFRRSGSTWMQEGPKLTGGGESGKGGFGASVALSSNGATALIGGPYDNNIGAAWFFTRAESAWTQLGSKLNGIAESGYGQFGYSVSLSADGAHALIGAPGNNRNAGAVWAVDRSGSTWTEQDSILTGRDEAGAGQFGTSVAVSDDGSMALIGAPGDNSGAGAAWSFARTGSLWAQQGSKLTGAGESGKGAFGWSVAIDALGDRALVGAPYNGAGAAWALTRAGTGWAEETPKLTGADGSGVSEFGYSAALALDGNDALIGGYFDDGGAGAAWHFARAGASWTQQGAKLTGSGAAGGSLFGWSAALSSDGSIALIGGPYDNSLAGAMWTFVPGASATVPRHGHPCRRRGRSQRGHRCRP